MADAGYTGDGGVKSSAQCAPKDLGHAPHEQSKACNVKANLISNQNFAHIFLGGQVEIFLKDHQQKKKDHAQKEIVGMHHRQGGLACKSLKFSKLPVEDAEYHGGYGVGQR